MLKKLLHLYKKYPAMYTETKGYDAFEWINCNDNDRSIFSFIRKTGEENYKNAIGFVTNFTPIAREDYRVGVPKSRHLQTTSHNRSRRNKGSKI